MIFPLFSSILSILKTPILNSSSFRCNSLRNESSGWSRFIIFFAKYSPDLRAFRKISICFSFPKLFTSSSLIEYSNIRYTVTGSISPRLPRPFSLNCKYSSNEIGLRSPIKILLLIVLLYFLSRLCANVHPDLVYHYQKQDST